MQRKIFDAIVEAQERIITDPAQQAFRAECESLNDRFLEQLATMNPEQQSAVMDYCGVVIEMHLRTLKVILEQKLEGESQ